MTTLLLLKDLYNDFFKDYNNKLVAGLFKSMSWFCFALIAVILYAFIYRIATGFPV